MVKLPLLLPTVEFPPLPFSRTDYNGLYGNALCEGVPFLAGGTLYMKGNDLTSWILEKGKENLQLNFKTLSKYLEQTHLSLYNQTSLQRSP